MEQILENPDTVSINEEPLSLNYETKGNDRLISMLYRKVEELAKKVHDIETKKILDETQLPVEILKENGLLPKVSKKLKTGKGYRPLLQSELEEAKKHSVSSAGQARWMGVSFATFKKYCKLYGIYDPGYKGRGKKQNFDPTRGKYPLTTILTGVLNGNPGVTEWNVKKKLLQNKMFEEKCNICGYSNKRVVDNKVCLLLDHKDGDLKNFKQDNLQLLCLNCTFECGRGYIRRGKALFDPDWATSENSSIISSTDK
jgi:hypothetical protein